MGNAHTRWGGGGGAALVHCGTPTPPRRCGGAALLWTFGYLLFFRTLGVWGLPEPPPYANALQLLLTLKVGGAGGKLRQGGGWGGTEAGRRLGEVLGRGN